MFIKPGDIISLSHYAKPFLTKSIVLEVNRESSEDIISVRITQEFAQLNLLEGDPIVAGFEKNENVYITNCYVHSVYPDQSLLKLTVNNEEYISNHRAFERFPVSLYADIEVIDSKHSFVAIVKNISHGGLMICAKENLLKDQSLSMKILIDKSELSLLSKVMWQLQRGQGFEYGLKISYIDCSSQNTLSHFLLQLKEEQENFLKQLYKDVDLSLIKSYFLNEQK
ncbi:MAG: PilZ domain-containing protein [Clostridia bacterium]|nr:PilZ domain-containing protein [Clostridia bacterium]